MIGLFGGTFDPIHYGHLRPAREALEALALDEVRFIPAGAPPHRAPPVASAADRLQMVRLALAGYPGFIPDEREIRRAGPSYTVLTLESLRAEFGPRPLCLLTGLDAFQGFETWHRWQEIPDLAHLVVLTRPGWETGQLPAWAAARLCTERAGLAQSPAGRLFFLSVSPQNISASAIRAALGRGEDIRGLVPEAVREFICHNHTYSHLNQRA
jgi:nicotinate-nucleotide adenylyltransferase